MRNRLLTLFFVAAAILGWGLYGPMLRHGQQAMWNLLHPAAVRPFLCVGLAFFVIAVVVPMGLLKIRREPGRWTITGAWWSFAAGIAGALGALGVVLAFKYRGRPVYIMPLVFGLGPVAYAFVSMWLAETLRSGKWPFYAALLAVGFGAGGVLLFQPVDPTVQIDDKEEGTDIHIVWTKTEEGGKETKEKELWVPNLEKLQTDEAAFVVYAQNRPLTWSQFFALPWCILLAALGWGVYGPLLHKGQTKMAGSRWRPFLCVGLAYFVVAVLLTLPMIKASGEASEWRTGAVMWSLAAGAAGAFGALAIIVAFDCGGRPRRVLPTVFGGASLVSTLTVVAVGGPSAHLSMAFLVSLGLLIAGSAAILVLTPRRGPYRPEEESAEPEPEPSAVAAASGSEGPAPGTPSERYEETIQEDDTEDPRAP